jgi:hypothetical protein
MQRSGYISKKIALEAANQVRKMLLADYPCTWECSTDKRGTKWFYQIDLVEYGKKTGLAVGPAFPNYIGFIVKASYTDCIQGADPKTLVTDLMKRMSDVTAGRPVQSSIVINTTPEMAAAYDILAAQLRLKEE